MGPWNVGLRMVCGCALLMVSVQASAEEDTKAPAPSSKGGAKEHVFMHAEGHLALLTDAPGRSVLAGTRGVALRGGYTWGRLGVFLHGERDFWFASEGTQGLTNGVLNIGPGVDYRFFNDRVRMSATVGTSTLMFDAIFHPKWTTGYFINARPGGLRWFPWESVAIEFHPLTFTVMSPAVTTPRIVHVGYRSALSLEWRL